MRAACAPCCPPAHPAAMLPRFFSALPSSAWRADLSTTTTASSQAATTWTSPFIRTWFGTSPGLQRQVGVVRGELSGPPRDGPFALRVTSALSGNKLFSGLPGGISPAVLRDSVRDQLPGVGKSPSQFNESLNALPIFLDIIQPAPRARRSGPAVASWTRSALRRHRVREGAVQRSLPGLSDRRHRVRE